jgi:CBS domain-containing protein
MGNALLMPARVMPVTSLVGSSTADDRTFLDSIGSALCALTDFHQHDPITVEIRCSIEDALDEMKRGGVHALLVTQQELGGSDLQVVGLITYRDIERRHQRHDNVALGEPNGVIRVGEVMTAWDELPLVRYESLKTLAGRNLHEMFQGTGLTHLLVVEFLEDDSVVARGLLSRAALDKGRYPPPTAASR